MTIARSTVELPVISQSVCKQIEAEATRMYPLETGGILARSYPNDETYVTQFIGPGPKALHESRSFEGDIDWQNERMSQLHSENPESFEYLGDWHTHPGASTGLLSFMDRRRLQKIMTWPKAGQPLPIMAIVFGEPQSWSVSVWRVRAPRGLFDRWLPSVDLVASFELPSP